MKNMMKKYDEMKNEALMFYKDLDVVVEDIELAIISLTMPEYAKAFNKENNSEIVDCSALAKVGNAICTYYLTNQKLNSKKDLLSNENLAKYGKELLEGHLFMLDNDLNQDTYKLAFDSLMGYLFLTDSKKANELLKKYIA